MLFQRLIVNLCKYIERSVIYFNIYRNLHLFQTFKHKGGKTWAKNPMRTTLENKTHQIKFNIPQHQSLSFTVI